MKHDPDLPESHSGRGGAGERLRRLQQFKVLSDTSFPSEKFLTPSAQCRCCGSAGFYGSLRRCLFSLEPELMLGDAMRRAMLSEDTLNESDAR